MILWSVVLLLAILSVAGHFARWWWVLDLASHFRVQYLVASALAAIVAAIAREPILVLIGLTTAWGNLASILPLYARRRPAPVTARPVRAFFLNVYEHNRHHARVARAARAANADVIALVEADAAFVAELRSHLPDYRYALVNEIGPRTAGVAALSRVRATRMELVDIGRGGSPVALVELDRDGARLTVLVAHPLPPYRETWFHHRNAYLHRLARLAAGSTGEVLLLGDLNTTSWSSHFTDLLRLGGLRDSRVGFGVHATWPRWFPPVGVPIDHALVSDGLAVLDRRVGGVSGSDHRSVVVVVA